MKEPAAALVNGDCREVLAAMAPESVHCVVTSPPYWGLRDYGIPPRSWGGDPACEHEWGVLLERVQQTGGRGEKQLTHPGNDGTGFASSSSCVVCGAWSGVLGLEPTPHLYVEHVVEIMGLVRRVLREDGTLWLNLGDCYATGAGKVGDCPGGGEQGERWKQMGPSSKSTLRGNGHIGGGPKLHAIPDVPAGFRGDNAGRYRDEKRRDHRAQVPDSKNPEAGIPTYQPNRMPIPGIKPKDLVGIPWRVAFALQADGWWLRSDVVWAKPNPMPESVTDRPTKAHEYLFLLTKAERYFYDQEAVKEPAEMRPQNRLTPRKGKEQGYPAHRRPDGSTDPVSRNLRSVWSVTTQPYAEAHFATFPPKLVEPCIKAGTSEHGVCARCGAPWDRVLERDGSAPYRTGKSAEKAAAGLVTAFSGYEDGSSAPIFRTVGWQPTCSCGADDRVPATVLDPFSGAGTAGLVAHRLGRSFIGIELNPAYCALAERRIREDAPMFAAPEVVSAASLVQADLFGGNCHPTPVLSSAPAPEEPADAP